MVSIIVPVYNAEKYLEECINSLINQTYRNLEILLVNDGSTDLSSEICKEYACKDSRIKYIFKENQGVSEARNTGLNEATGNYILFVDSDDWLPVDTVEKMVSRASDKNADIVLGSYLEAYPSEDKYVLFDEEYIVGEANIAEYIADKYLTAIASSPWAKLFSREFIGNIRFDKGMSLGEDLFFNLHCFEKAQKIMIIKEYCYNYRLTNELTLTKSYKSSYYDSMKKIYKYSNTYFDRIEESHNCKISREKVARKLFVYSVAFSVRQVERKFSKSDCKTYISALCNDDSFIQAINMFRTDSLQEKVLIYLFKKNKINLLYQIICLRALVRS